MNVQRVVEENSLRQYWKSMLKSAKKYFNRNVKYSILLDKDLYLMKKVTVEAPSLLINLLLLWRRLLLKNKLPLPMIMKKTQDLLTVQNQLQNKVEVENHHKIHLTRNHRVRTRRLERSKLNGNYNLKLSELFWDKVEVINLTVNMIMQSLRKLSRVMILFNVNIVEENSMKKLQKDIFLSVKLKVN